MLALRVNSSALNALGKQAAKLGHADDAAMAGGTGVRLLLVNHFQQLDATRANKMGGPRSHFYAQAAKATSNPKPDGSGTVAITINKVGLAQRWLGGPITAGKGASSSSGGPTKYLAIPARAETYGKAPGEFADLTFIPFKSGRRGRGGMLVEALQTPLVGKRGKRLKNPARGAGKRETGGLVMFWLVDQVNQKADPTVMPTESEMLHAAAQAMDGYVTRLLASKP